MKTFLDSNIMKKIWFCNFVLLFMWIAVIVIECLPWIKIESEVLKTILYTTTGGIPVIYGSEIAALWGHYKINVKNVLDKTEEKEKEA